MIDTDSHSCCSASVNISIQKDISSIFIQRFSSHGCISCHCLVLVLFQYAPFTVHYRAQIVYRLSKETGEGLSYRWRCQLPQQMPFYPDFRCELRTVESLLCVGVRICVCVCMYTLKEFKR